MAILEITSETTGLVGVLPRIVYIVTDDSLTTIMSSGYLTNAAEQFPFNSKDVALVSYKDTPTDKDGKAAWLEIVKSGDSWSLAPTQAAGSVTLPVTDNAAVRFNGVGGAIQDSTVTINDSDEIESNGSVTVDNLIVTGNSISSINTNGDILVAPDGTGEISLASDETYVGQDIIHKGDTNNLIKFESDSQKFQTDGTDRLIVTNSGAQFGTGATVTTILNEDDMVSDSATSLVTQQSFKAYADAAASSSGGSQWTYEVLSSTQTTNSTSYIPIPGLSFTPTANTSYEIQFYLLMQTSSTGRDWGVGYNWPTDVDGGGWSYLWDNVTNVGTGLRNDTMFYPDGTNAGHRPSNMVGVNVSVIVEGRIVFVAGPSVSGDFELTYSVNSGSGTTFCTAGSFLRYYAYA